MITTIEQILDEIESDNNELRELLQKLSKKDLTPMINELTNSCNTISSCGNCLTADELNKIVTVNSKVVSFLRIISNKGTLRSI